MPSKALLAAAEARASATDGRFLGIRNGAGAVDMAALVAGKDEIVAYLTMAEALKLAAQTYTTDIAHLSCCAA